MEQPVFFYSENLRLSGLLHRGSGGRAALVTHPHPLYGGNMYNPVVEAVTRAYQAKGHSTLRFDFRGTGDSQGQFGGGRKETADVIAAIDYLAGTGASTIDLAGYSFGAWVCALGAAGLKHPGRMVMVSPPVAFLDFTGIPALPGLELVITGSEDEFAPPDLIREMLPAWNPEARLLVLDGADHSFFGFDRELEKAVGGAVE